MLKGLRRIVGASPEKVRRGVAAQALRRAMDIMLDPSNPRDANIRAALASAFQGLMRSYEYCDTGKGPRGTKAVLSRIPTRKDLKVLTAERLVFMMCPCKNMKHLSGKTVPLVIGGGGTYIDAAAEMLNLMKVDPTPSGRCEVDLSVCGGPKHPRSGRWVGGNRNKKTRGAREGPGGRGEEPWGGGVVGRRS
eukprot:1410247-Prymnesium_polylepis.1